MSFESVKQSGPTWQPTQTGSKKEKNLTPLTANDKSFVEGYYLGAETGKGPDGNSTIHRLKVTKVGDKTHIVGEREKGQDEVSIWGTAVLNDNLSKIAIGSMCRIVWEGKKQPKKGGNDYHGWDVLVDNSVEPYSGAALPQASSNEAAAIPETSPVAEGVDGGDDDDLPF